MRQQQVVQNNNNSGGIGFVGALTILFIALKLTGYINWSWLWVLSPIWITAGVVILFLVLFFGIGLLAALISDSRRRKRYRNRGF